MRRKFRIVVGLAVALNVIFSSACSSTPSTSAAEEFIRDRIKQQSEDKIRLISFQKTNGQEMAPNGVPLYALEYEAEIEFLERCRWGTKNDFDGKWRGDFAVFPPRDEPGFFGGAFYPFGDAEKGSRTKVQAFVLFQKTEQGWIPVNPPMF